VVQKGRTTGVPESSPRGRGYNGAAATAGWPASTLGQGKGGWVTDLLESGLVREDERVKERGVGGTAATRRWGEHGRCHVTGAEIGEGRG
jgi:hypothetical protein